MKNSVKVSIRIKTCCWDIDQKFSFICRNVGFTNGWMLVNDKFESVAMRDRAMRLEGEYRL